MTATDAPFTETAHAKINLTLHVTGQRADGYHLLDSIVCFTSLGDVIQAERSKHNDLKIEGPFADGLSTDQDNLVARAAKAFGSPKAARILLTKKLPVASGIGGGSADAAAALRALSRLWRLPLPDDKTILSLGADVPVCMSTDLTRMRGIGDELDRLGPLPELDLVLVNPGVSVSTKGVFDGLNSKTNPPPTEAMPSPVDRDAWIVWLRKQRNDLEAPAKAAFPVIGETINAIASQRGCLLSRMSGSGATCFGIFTSTEAAVTAQNTLRAAHPNWWVQQTCEAEAI